ncbi:retrovirus-related pol polyprotein from transposon TNT 1-94, partial [Tanacetum coccineum]
MYVVAGTGDGASPELSCPRCNRVLERQKKLRNQIFRALTASADVPSSVTETTDTTSTLPPPPPPLQKPTGMIKRSKCENKEIVPTEMEQVLEYMRNKGICCPTENGASTGIYPTRQKPGQYICCQNHKLIADIEDDIMDPHPARREALRLHSYEDPPKSPGIQCSRLKKASQNGWKRYKARLVVKGSQQKRGVDYNEIFSPVMKMTIIKLVLSIVAAGAFLCGVTPPDGAWTEYVSEG